MDTQTMNTTPGKNKIAGEDIAAALIASGVDPDADRITALQSRIDADALEPGDRALAVRRAVEAANHELDALGAPGVLRLIRTDMDNCRVYYRGTEGLYAFQRERRDVFALYRCTASGEPMYPVDLKAIDKATADYPEFSTWAEGAGVLTRPEQQQPAAPDTTAPVIARIRADSAMNEANANMRRLIEQLSPEVRAVLAPAYATLLEAFEGVRDRYQGDWRAARDALNATHPVELALSSEGRNPGGYKVALDFDSAGRGYREVAVSILKGDASVGFVVVGLGGDNLEPVVHASTGGNPDECTHHVYPLRERAKALELNPAPADEPTPGM